MNIGAGIALGMAIAENQKTGGQEMKLIDADLLESNLRAKAKEIDPHWTVMARAYEDAADMVKSMPSIERNANLETALVAAFNLGYKTGKEQE